MTEEINTVTYPYPPGAPQVPGYPPQQPGFPSPPAQGGYPAQQPGFPPQYGQQAPPAGPYGYPAQQPGFPAPGQQPPAPELAQGTLDAFWSQPSTGGGAALKFEQVGTTHVGVVSRAVTDSDVQQQTQVGSNLPAFFKDGRPKFVMKVPLQVRSDATHPDGIAQWFCSGQASQELVRAMGEAGAPQGPPEAGAVIAVTFTGTRSAGPGMNPAKNYQVHYWRPGDPAGMQYAAQCGVPTAIAPATAHVPAAPAAPQAQPPAQQYAQQQQQYAPPAAAAAPPMAPPPPPAAVPQPPPPAPAPAPAATGMPAPPVPSTDGMTPEQQQLLAQLLGQQQGAPAVPAA